MPSQTYERYGLTGNPFRELASENLEDIEIYHVSQDVDDTLRTIKDEVFDKENRSVVAVVGALGAGKTERLLLAAAEGRERKAFTVFFDVTTRAQWILRGLATEFQKEAASSGLAKTFSAPSWLKSVAALSKLKDEQYDPKEVGRILGGALNDQAPSFLLLNDLHNVVESREVESFVQVLQEITDVIRPGVLLMFGCYSSYMAWLTVKQPALASRINRTFLLLGLTNDQAGLVLAKKLLAKRVVEDLDPIFPFDRESVKEINTAATGNPRRLLELADLSLEYAVQHRSYRVDLEVVRTVLGRRNPTAPPPRPPTATLPAAPRSLLPDPVPVKTKPGAPDGPEIWTESG
jgi:type II secretory pathway predicted ATPase ExeA